MTSLTGNRRIKYLMYLIAFATVGFGFFFSAFHAAFMSAIVLVFASIMVNRRDGLSAIGVGLSKRKLTWFVVAFLCSAVLATLTVIGTLKTSPKLKMEFEAFPLLLVATVFLQSFVEEVLFRVYLMKQILGSLISSMNLLCFCSALLFSFAHFVNYRLSEGVSLSAAPLLTLFLMGFAGSALYLKQGHILGAWGFHAGWNTVRFAVVFWNNGDRVPESMTFELLEGSWIGLGIGGGLAAFAIIHQMQRKPT